jgi:hypothetical protein
MTVRGVTDPIAASGGWAADDTYTMKVARYRTPFATTFRFRFAGDQLVVDSEANVGAADSRIVHYTGTLASGTVRTSH